MSRPRFEADMKISGNESPIRVRLDGMYEEAWYRDGNDSRNIPLQHLMGDNDGADEIRAVVKGVKGSHVSVKGSYMSEGKQLFGWMEGTLESARVIEINENDLGEV